MTTFLDLCAVSVESVDAAGELTLVAHEGGGAVVRQHGLKPIRERDVAWKENPLCVVCLHGTKSPDDAGYVMTPTGGRVTCKGSCYVTAVKRFALPLKVQPGQTVEVR
jgi:hypothetical protein